MQLAVPLNDKSSSTQSSSFDTDMKHMYTIKRICKVAYLRLTMGAVKIVIPSFLWSGYE